MTRPKSKPKKQISKPKSKSLWPFTPRKSTFERSGSLKFASPPPSRVSAIAALAPTNKNPAPARILRREPQPSDQALLSQVCIYDPPDDSFWAHRTGIVARVPAHLLPALETSPFFLRRGKPCRLM